MDDINNSSNNSEECSICLEELNQNDKLKLICGHKFHYKCINTWLIKNNRCPICRTFLKKNFKVNISIKSKNICDVIFHSRGFGIKEFGLSTYYLPYYNYEYKFNENEKRILMANRNNDKNKFKIRNKLNKYRYEIIMELENHNEFSKFKELLLHICNNFGMI
jgi:hypothetical protein